MFQELVQKYKDKSYDELGKKHLDELYEYLPKIKAEEITSVEDGKNYIELLKKFREAVAENDKFHGKNYSQLLKSVLSVGEDGLYSNNLRFIFELIQNVDDCDYEKTDFCCLDMKFDFYRDQIILTYNEKGFTPFNVFAITGIAEAAKNISSTKNEIGEKGIGFKSVFGVAKKVWIKSGFFSFELSKNNFTVPIYHSANHFKGTQMVLYVPNKAEEIYEEIKEQYCKQEALFSKNPILFLNKLTSLKIYNNSSENLEFHVSRSEMECSNNISIERNVKISLKLHSTENSLEREIYCSRYSYPVIFTRKACKSRYGEDTLVGNPNGKPMVLKAMFLNPEYISKYSSEEKTGALYSFLPTQLKLRVPIVCHVPFKLDASREFVDPQDNNSWFKEASYHLSKLLDNAYMDWRNIVKEKIVYYLAGYLFGIFKSNNGKEDCLRKQICFSGQHYLDLPLFYTADGTFHRANEIFCFDSSEKITKQETVWNFMKFQKYLFTSPIPVEKFGIVIEKDIKNRLFQKALADEKLTAEILNYLDSIGYPYPREQIQEKSDFVLTSNQVKIIFNHEKLAEMLRSLQCEGIKRNKIAQIKVINTLQQSLYDVLGDNFELNETPRQVEKYMKFCHEKCICLDIGENKYLPCQNALILSKQNCLDSFTAFCHDIDPKDPFVTRMRLREASEQLNNYEADTLISVSDYIHNLRNVRKIIKDSLGNNGYKNYIDLILRAGTDKERFIHELLQNADDCNYPPNVTPTFHLSYEKGKVITQYNEIGFSRADIRSITAIGESTKHKIVNGQLSPIGEKGIGFKTIFAVTSEVKIYSGEFAFSLTDREPTIPKPLNEDETNSFEGTKMEMTIKNKTALFSYNEKTILELCICLRKLKKLTIGSHEITIEDTDTQRTITIDTRQYIFKRFIHTFTIKDENAIAERQAGNRAVLPEQRIICFVPEKNAQKEYFLYNGLPTKHKMNIPLVIDAPFALTTSREEIETGFSTWNDIIRKELYSALLKVMINLKVIERAKIFRFIRFVPRRYGQKLVYVNEMSDCSYLNEYNFLDDLRSCQIIPTFSKNVFSIQKNKNAYCFPDFVHILIGMLTTSEYEKITAYEIIDIPNSDDFKSTLNALKCETADFNRVFRIIMNYAEKYIDKNEFSKKLYEYLNDKDTSIPDEYKQQLKKLAIIPVYGTTPGNTKYISWADDSIFVKRGVTTSKTDYYILREDLLPKSVCEKIFDVYVNEMNETEEHNRYNKKLEKLINGSNMERIYSRLLDEYNSGALQKNNSLPILLALKEKIPLKNQLDEIDDTMMFLCDQPVGYFSVKILQRLIVNKECEGLAKYIKCQELKNIHYEDVDYYESLTADDIEQLNNSYFVNSEEILRKFYYNGLISDELLPDELGYLKFISLNDYDKNYTFPEEPVLDRNRLISHVRKSYNDKRKIVSVKVERTVKKGQNPDGSTFELINEDTRKGAMRIYTPEGTKNYCFCQICQQINSNELIEVNNLELEPEYYVPQLRVALCLNCSKYFKSLRANDYKREKYIEAIKNADIQEQGKISIPIDQNKTLTFTATHLAEIQEILKLKQS